MIVYVLHASMSISSATYTVSKHDCVYNTGTYVYTKENVVEY